MAPIKNSSGCRRDPSERRLKGGESEDLIAPPRPPPPTLRDKMRAGAPETRSRQRHFKVGQMPPPLRICIVNTDASLPIALKPVSPVACRRQKKKKKKKTANKAYLHEPHSSDDNRRSCDMRQQSAPTAEAQLSRLRPAVLQRLDPIWGLKYDRERLTGENV